MKLKKLNLVLSILFFSFLSLAAQKPEIKIIPDHPDWKYKIGEKAVFDIRIQLGDSLLKNIKIKYTIGYEKQIPFLTKEVILPDGTFHVEAEGMKAPGFLTCRVYLTYGEERLNNLTQIAYNPEDIKPITTTPKDFNKFWAKALNENKKIPMDPIVTLMPEYCTDKVNVYHVGIQSYKIGQRIYGILSVPKKEGKYPVILQVPGAGVHKIKPDFQPVNSLVEKGFITFQIGVHGLPLTQDEKVYADLFAGSLKNYMYFNLNNKDEYYYKRVFIGCVRSIDYLVSLPQYDGKNAIVWGGSQGGGLTLVTTGLDSRVKYYVCFYPALCDHLGYTVGRAGGWPHMFSIEHPENIGDSLKMETSKYYDAVNFARKIKVPGFISFGYNDLSCPITSMYAAYNIIRAPKELMIVKENGHKRSPNQDKRSEEWLLEKLNLSTKYQQ